MYLMPSSNLSHIGMIIHSTTLDTMAKVIEKYGGTEWTKLEGVFLLGANSAYAVNSTGGEATHTLTVAEMPAHNHGYNQAVQGRTDVSGSNAAPQSAMNGYSWVSTGGQGGNQAHNNMPPYKAVYIWERTA